MTYELVTDAPALPPASGSGRRVRSDRLLHYGVDPAHARVVKQRIGPLARYYWHRQGGISIEELCMSAYIQGMMDAEQIQRTIENEHRNTIPS